MIVDRRERWREALLRHRGRGMNGEVRSLLLWISVHQHCKPDASFAIPRSEMAKAFAVPESRITERLGRAEKLGLLTTIKTGKRGTTAVRQGCVPGAADTTGWRGKGPSPRTDKQGTSPRTHRKGPSPRTDQAGENAPIGSVSPYPNQQGTSPRTHKSGSKGPSPRAASLIEARLISSPNSPTPEQQAPEHLAQPRTGPDYEPERRRQLDQLDQLIASETT